MKEGERVRRREDDQLIRVGELEGDECQAAKTGTVYEGGRYEVRTEYLLPSFLHACPMDILARRYSCVYSPCLSKASGTRRDETVHCFARVRPYR